MEAEPKPTALLSDDDHSMPVTDYPSSFGHDEMEMAKLMLPDFAFVMSDGQNISEYNLLSSYLAGNLYISILLDTC
jgi:hypothetical protein